MVNTEDFIKRLQKVIDYHGESASSFAEKIGVQRSSISHILSGRNKPSLDFILKVLSAFPEVDLYWLFNGKGEFPATELKQIKTEKSNINTSDLFSVKYEEETNSRIMPEAEKNNETDKSIERIVIFYTDGTFKNFNN